MVSPIPLSWLVMLLTKIVHLQPGGLFRFPRLASWDRRCLSRRLDIEAIAGRPFALYLYNTAGRGSALPESVLPRKFSKVQA